MSSTSGHKQQTSARHAGAFREPGQSRRPWNNGPDEKKMTQKQVSEGAKALIERKEYAKAEALLIAASNEDPKNRKFYTQLIKLYGILNNLPTAEFLFNEAKRNGAENTITYNAFLDALYDNGRYHKMLEVIAAEPGNVQRRYDIRIRKIEALRKLNKYDEAVAECDSLLRRDISF